MSARPPGPEFDVPEAAVRFHHNPAEDAVLRRLSELHDAYQENGITRMPTGEEFDAYFLTNAEDIFQVLVKHAPQTSKWITRKRKHLAGNVSETHKSEKKIIQSIFNNASLSTQVHLIVETLEEYTHRWHDGQEIELYNELTSIAQKNFIKVMLGEESEMAFSTGLEKLFSQLVDEGHDLKSSAYVPVGLMEPLLAETIQRSVHDELSAKTTGSSLLARLLKMAEKEGALGFEQQVTGEVIMLFVLSHLTVFNLTWVWYHLARNPDLEDRVLAEIAKVLGGRKPHSDDLAKFTLVTKILKESVRLHPPTRLIHRVVVEPFPIQGFEMPVGSLLDLSVYNAHRNAKYFKDPEVFDPDRWTMDMEAALPPGAYLPFGAGPHACVGRKFDLTESVLAIAMIVPRFRFTLTESTPSEEFSLLPPNNLPVVVNRRDDRV